MNKSKLLIISEIFGSVYCFTFLVIAYHYTEISIQLFFRNISRRYVYYFFLKRTFKRKSVGFGTLHVSFPEESPEKSVDFYMSEIRHSGLPK
jgi:hypothetical protein